jgi:malate dehydrogenase (oxaloacetate-decarboxylating)
MLATARALAANSPALKDTSASLLPPLTDLRRVVAKIALALGTQAQKDGVAAKLGEDELRQQVTATQWTPEYPSYYDER